MTNNYLPKEAKVGDFFEIEGDLAILAQVSFFKVCLICLRTANRYNDPVDVKDLDNLTPEEIEKVFAYYRGVAIFRAYPTITA